MPATHSSLLTPSQTSAGNGYDDGRLPRLDLGTFSVAPERAPGRRYVADVDWWRVKVYPKAEEATLTPWRRPALRTDERRAEIAQRGEIRRQLLALAVEDERRRLAEIEQAMINARACRRARTVVRRLCRQYELCYMWTLTYRGEGCHDREQLVRDLEQFARDMKARFHLVPWLAVPELHPDGHGYHIHLAVDRYLYWRDFNEVWPHGHTETPRREDGTPMKGQIDASDTAAYLAKYITKIFKSGAEIQRAGEHRYFRPKWLEVEETDLGDTMIFGADEARRVIIAAFGGQLPTVEWLSDLVPDWDGPPVIAFDFRPRKEETAGRRRKRRRH